MGICEFFLLFLFFFLLEVDSSVFLHTSLDGVCATPGDSPMSLYQCICQAAALKTDVPSPNTGYHSSRVFIFKRKRRKRAFFFFLNCCSDPLVRQS